MDAGGLGADEELRPDLGVGASLAEQPQDGQLSGGESEWRCYGRRRFLGCQIDASSGSKVLDRMEKRRMTKMTDDDWNSVLAVNLSGAFFLAQAAGPVPLMARRRWLRVDSKCERGCDDQRSLHVRASAQTLRERHGRGLTWRLFTLTPNEPTDQATKHQSYE